MSTPVPAPAMPPAKLSEHFTFLEMTRTNHRRYLEANRQVSPALVERGRALCRTLLEPVRAEFGPVIIHSGYRCPPLNRAVGGSASSQHMQFEAADFHVHGHNLKEVWEWVWKRSGLNFGQLILEGWAMNRPGWIHLSLGHPYRPKAKCNQVMTMVAGRYTVVRQLPWRD